MKADQLIEKYIGEKVIDLASKIKDKEKIKTNQLKEIMKISGNMINALSFVIEEAKYSEKADIKKIKNMYGKIIKELQAIRSEL